LSITILKKIVEKGIFLQIILTNLPKKNQMLYENFW